MSSSKRQKSKNSKKSPVIPITRGIIINKSIPQWLWFAISFIGCFIVSQQFQIVYNSLDDSWNHAVANATIKGYNFADRFIFTYGPAWFFEHHIYHPQLYYIFLLSNTLTSIVFAIFVINGRRKILSLLFLLWVYLIQNFDYGSREYFYYFFLILLMHRLAVSFNKLTMQNVLILLWLAFMSFTKFSFFLMIFPVFILIDITNIMTKKYSFPLIFSAYWACLISVFIILRQNILTLFSFYKNSLQVSTGYSTTMQCSLDVAGVTQTYILIGMLLFFAMASIVELFRHTKELKIINLSQPVALSMALVWMLFILFKAGYVRCGRQGLNTQIVFVALMIYILLIYFDRIKGYFIVCFICLITTCFILLPEQNIFDVNLALKNLSTLTFRKQSLDREFAQVKNSLNANIPIPKEASVDSYNWDLTELILGGYNYDPRPVPQTYSSYTPKLQNIDSAYLIKNKTNYVILNIGDIDQRYPTIALGKSLIDMYLYYDVNNYCIIGYGPHVILKRRETPRIKETIDTFSTEFAAGKVFTLPEQKSDFREAYIEFKPTLLGKIKNFLLHEDISWIEVTTEAGSAYKFRFIPTVSNNGFLLSPVLLSTGDYVLYKDAGKIRTIKIYSERSSMFNAMIKIKLNDFNVTGAAENALNCNYNELLAALSGGMLNVGYNLIQQGRLDSASKVFNSILANAQGRPVAHLHNYMGMVYLKQNKPKEAEQEFNTEISLNLEKEEAYFQLGVLYIQINAYDKSLHAWENVIALNSKNADAYNNMGVCYINSNIDIKKAQECFEKSVELNPDNIQGYFNVLICAQRNNDNGAFFKYLKLLLQKGINSNDIKAKGINIPEDMLKKIIS